MAPELRAPHLQGCTLASDMYSVGGLLFVSFYPDVTASMVQVAADGEIAVREHESNVDVAVLVRKLLSKEPAQRPTASEALAFPLFASAGAQQLEHIQQQQRELDRLRAEADRKQAEAAQELWRERAAVEAEKRQVQGELAREIKRVKEGEHRLREQDRRQQEAERQLREKQARVKRLDDSLRAQQRKAEQEHCQRQRLLSDREQHLRRERQALEEARFPRPDHWTQAAAAPRGQGASLALIPVPPGRVFRALQEHLNGTGVGDGGRDQQQHGRYSALKLVRAWRVEHDDLHAAYRVACRRVQSLSAQAPLRKDRKARIRRELYAASQALPWELDKSVNEVRLLHGTRPELVLSILHNGMNERFAGSSAGTAFGDVSVSLLLCLS